MLSLRLPINSRLLVEFGGSQSYACILNCAVVRRSVNAPDPHIVQGPTLFPRQEYEKKDKWALDKRNASLILGGDRTHSLMPV